MFQITKEWIETFCTDRGGYTMDQVRCLGFEKGFREKNWKKKAVGQWITEDAKLRFQELSSRKLAKGERKKIKQERIKAEKEAYIACDTVKKFSRPMTTEFIQSNEFLKSFTWLQLRMKVLAKHGNRCECCGATPKDGVKICVDHIKPRKFYPQLALDERNLQVLCDDCNFGKGNGFVVNWSERQ